MHDVVVRQQEQVVGVVEACNGVGVALVEIPRLVKLIECQDWLHTTHTRSQSHAYQSLCDGGRQGGREEGGKRCTMYAYYWVSS